MEKKTFVLRNKKTYRRGIRIFIKDKDGKFKDRLLNFTTEHLVDEKQRTTNARKIHGEYTTEKLDEISALFSDSAYGKDFYLKGDPDGKLKTATIKVTNDDAKKIALRNLFTLADLPFDDSKPFEVLNEEYNLYAQSFSGRRIGASTAKAIPVEMVDVAEGIASAKAAARELYFKKYGEEVPGVVRDDTAFLDGLSNPDFDAKKYIESKTPASSEEDDNATEGKEALRDAYFQKFGKNVPNPKLNDLPWIKAKLEE